MQNTCCFLRHPPKKTLNLGFFSKARTTFGRLFRWTTDGTPGYPYWATKCANVLADCADCTYASPGSRQSTFYAKLTNVDALCWKSAAVAGVCQVLPVRRGWRNGPSKMFNILRPTIIIPKVPQTLPERRALQPEVEQILVERSEASVSTTEQVERQRQQS